MRERMQGQLGQIRNIMYGLAGCLWGMYFYGIINRIEEYRGIANPYMVKNASSLIEIMGMLFIAKRGVDIARSLRKEWKTEYLFELVGIVVVAGIILTTSVLLVKNNILLDGSRKAMNIYLAMSILSTLALKLFKWK